MELLEKIKTLILNQQDESLFSVLLENTTKYYSDDKIAQFLLSITKKSPFCHSCVISGSGGSGIIKPNIGSICSLYLACYGIPVVKIGSRAITSSFGSTDFFEELGIVDCVYDDGQFKFAYYDNRTFSPWQMYRNLLSINKSFERFFKKCVFHEVKSNNKLVGLLGENARVEYMSKKHYNTPEKICVVYSVLSDKYIDEIVPNMAWKDGQKLDISIVPYEKITQEKINQINYSLLDGTCNNEFWKNSLFYTFAVALSVCDNTKTIEYGYEQAKRMFEQGKVFDFVKLIRNSYDE